MPNQSEDRRALYLRWRPSTFADVVGQEHVVRTLRNAVVTTTPAHAYLFAGPRGTGKTSVARILYRAVNCLDSRGGDPCGECGICSEALTGRALDLVEVDAASNRGIDDIRELREKVAFSPAKARFRVYIVDEVHELTAPAWDAFLKTLEEPPPHAIFVLATTEAYKVPGTIVSRCQRFDFRRIQPKAIRDRLLEIARSESLTLTSVAAERLARMARGGLRDAVSLLEQAASFTSGVVDLDALREVLGLADPQMVQQVLERVSRRDAAGALALVVEISATGADLRLFAEDLALQLRGLLYAGSGASPVLLGEFSAEDVDWLEREHEHWSPLAVKELLKIISDVLIRVRDSGQFQLYLELAIIEAATGFIGTAPSKVPASRAVESVGGEAAVPSSERVQGALETHLPPYQGEIPTPSSPNPIGPQPQASVVEPTEKVLAGSSPVEDVIHAQQVTSLEIDRVKAAWPRVLEWVANRNAYVASYLRPAEVQKLEGNLLTLSFAYKLHHTRVAEQRNRALVEQACEQVLGQHLLLRCEHVAPSPSGSRDIDFDDPVLKFALARFGGRAELVD